MALTNCHRMLITSDTIKYDENAENVFSNRASARLDCAVAAGSSLVRAVRAEISTTHTSVEEVVDSITLPMEIPFVTVPLVNIHSPDDTMPAFLSLLEVTFIHFSFCIRPIFRTIWYYIFF